MKLKTLILAFVIGIGMVLKSGYAEDNSPEIEQHNDANSGKDVAGDTNDPYIIDYGKYKGMLTEDDSDAYGIKYTPGDRITFIVTPDKNLDVALGVVSNKGGYTRSKNKEMKGVSETWRETVDSKREITNYRILVSAVSGVGNYTLEITKESQNDGDNGKDAPGSYSSPLSLNSGVYKDCYLGLDDSCDLYEVKLNEKQKAVITVIPSKTLDIGLATGDYATAGMTSKNSEFKGVAEKIKIDAYKTGIYKFAVILVSGEGAYTLKIVKSGEASLVTKAEVMKVKPKEKTGSAKREAKKIELNDSQVLLLIAEQNIASQWARWWWVDAEVDLSVTESAIAEKLIAGGYEVIDPSLMNNIIRQRPALHYRDLSDEKSIELANLSGAGYVIAGKAIASVGSRVLSSNLFSYFSNISAKLIRVKDGKIIAYLDTSGKSAHMDSVTGGKEALHKAAVDLAIKVVNILDKQKKGQDKR